MDESARHLAIMNMDGRRSFLPRGLRGSTLRLINWDENMLFLPETSFAHAAVSMQRYQGGKLGGALTPQ